ncbi:MAG: PIG-L family deacetylase [Gemmatimonadota bacterium]
MADRYDVLAIGAHPDDMEVVMGGTAAKLVDRGLRVLFVDLCDGEPARHASPGERSAQAAQAAEVLGVDRHTLGFRDRLIRDTPECRIEVAHLIRTLRPRLVFTTEGCGVHPDHKAVTDVVTNAVFYARLPKWDRVPGGERLAESEPHEIERLFFGHCRMEAPWPRFDFAVDVSEVHDRKLRAIAAYESVFSGDQAALLDRYGTEDRYVGGLVGVRCAGPFKARSPLLVEDPSAFAAVPYG